MIHLVGIGGIGMSAIARLLLARGGPVSGSDLRRTPLIERLEAEGAQIAIGHRAENVDRAARVVISSAIDVENPELRRARERGLPIVTRGEMLAELTRDKKTIAIAGTHGKTTTTSMVAVILEAAGLDPTVAVGGERVGSDINARLGDGPWFVTESDESDGSFLLLRPAMAVITNIENDHISSDAEIPKLLAQFKEFIAHIADGGLVVLCTDDRRARELGATLGSRRVVTCGLTADAQLHATIESFDGFGTTSQIFAAGKPLGELRLNVPGEINVKNALPALAIARELGVEFAVAAEALSTFRGVRRRFEILARGATIVVDDYAHHPTAVRATIAVARRYHAGPIAVAFQPHRYTRTAYLAADFADALSGADLVVLAPIYAASESPIEGISERSIGEPLRARGVDVRYVAAVQELPSYLLAHAPEGSLVLVLGAGNVSAQAHALAQTVQPISVS